MTEATKKARKRKPQGLFSNELLDQLLALRTGNYAESLLGESGLIGQLKKQLAEPSQAPENAAEQSGNHRNGSRAPRPY